MKKLLTILAASAMFFAFGDVTLPNGMNFEDYTAIGEGSFDPQDNDPGTDYHYWYSASSVGNVISNHVVAPTLPAGATCGLPDMFNNDNSNTNFLYVETESQAPLFRTVGTNDGNPTNFTGVSILDNPIYLDTLVKFTAADSAFTSFEDAADKIAIEYVEHEEESHEDPEGHTNIVDSVGFTNFVIRAGYLSSPIAQTNYYAAVPANFEKDAWHRLTVRSFGSIDEAGNVGFVVYLDGVPLQYDTNVDVGPGFTPSGAAAAFYTESLHALFPSAIPANQTGGQAIAAVAFSGNGSIDDVVFTTETPNFIKATELVRAEITLGTGVSDVTVTVESTYEAAETNGTKFVFNLPAGTTTFGLNVTADTANGYTFDAATGITASNDVTYVGTTITVTGASPALTLVGKRDNAYYMDGETKVGFATLSEAFTSAPAGTTIKLGYDYVVGDMETVSDSAPVFVIAKNVVLDLNGKELDGGSSNARALFSVNSGCVLTIIDSVAGDDGSIVYGGTFGMFAGKGRTNIGSADDCGPVINGAVIGNKGYVDNVVRGKFTAADNTAANGKFVCATDEEDEYEIPYGIDVVDSNSTVTLVGDYWVVAPQGGSATFALTTTGGANATVTTSPADVSALTVATEVTITATAAQDYTYNGVGLSGTDWTYDSQTDAISMTLTVSADTAITVPDAVAKTIIGTYEVTVIPTNNATYAVTGAASNVGDVYTVATGHSITITVTPDSNYEYASAPAGWTAGANGVITKVVDAPGTVVIPEPTAKSNWPAGWNSGNEPASMVTAFNTWIAAGNDPTAANAEAAFLVGVNVADYTNDFAAASISIVGGKIVITGNYNLSSVNGALAVKMGDAPNALNTTTAVAKEALVEGAISLTPALGETKKFYQLVIGYPAN